jgi:hypothetical protein
VSSGGGEPATKAAYKAAVRAQVERDDWVTFAALHKRLAGDAREATEIVLPGNRVIWAGMPRALFDAILELLDEAVLAAKPVHPSAYRRDGRVLSLPVEKTIPSEGHAEPHWFPVALRPMAAVLAEESDPD